VFVWVLVSVFNESVKLFINYKYDNEYVNEYNEFMKTDSDNLALEWMKIFSTVSGSNRRDMLKTI